MILKRLASHLPARHQQELKRLRFARLISTGSFAVVEAKDREFPRLAEWVKAGDWVLDIGASVGSYAARLSELVGPNGRVFAFEPVLETFELLSSNVARFPLRNITLLNVAVSDSFGLVGMTVPEMDGRRNPYMAHLTQGRCDLSVVCMPVDALGIPRHIALAKIDVEGQELAVLKGMGALLERDRPVLIVEGRSPEVASYLESFGYSYQQADRSPNRLFRAVR